MARKQTRDYRNPYLCLLIKRFLQYEIGGMLERVSDLKIAGRIYERNKPFSKSETHFNSPPGIRDEPTYQFADNIRSEVLPDKDFYFSIDTLNNLARQIFVVGTYENWSDFEKEFGYDQGAILARDQGGGAYSSLSQTLRDLIEGLVQKRMVLIHLRLLREGYGRKIIFSTDDLTFRSGSLKEFLTTYRTHLSSGEVQLSKATSFYDINDNVYFLLLDDYEVLAEFIILPLTPKGSARLFASQADFNSILKVDIVAALEGREISHLHIPFFKIYKKEVFKLVVKNLLKAFHLTGAISEKTSITITGKVMNPYLSVMPIRLSLDELYPNNSPLWDEIQFDVVGRTGSYIDHHMLFIAPLERFLFRNDY